MDLFAKLPDEVLCQVFSNMPSVLDTFKLAAVNRKFRRCSFVAMKKPQPLEIEFPGGILSLCGHQLANNWLPAVEVLTKEARFSRINISKVFLTLEVVPQLLHTLAATPDCLTQVTEIKVNWEDVGLYNPTGNGLASLIGNCAKLSVLQLDFHLVPDRCQDRAFGRSPVDLVTALKDKALTKLDLTLARYTQQELIDLFRSLKPNTLKTLKMRLFDMLGLDVAGLVGQLCVTAGESLEDLEIQPDYHVRQEPTVTELFVCISNLPALRRLSTSCAGIIIQFDSALKLLLSNHARARQLIVHCMESDLNHFPNCQLLTRIHQLEKEIPRLVFGFDHDIEMLKLSLGNVVIGGLHELRQKCDNPNCNDCGSCYPIVIDSLVFATRWQEDTHLENHWLHRCAIGQVLEELNKHNSTSHGWKALNVVENQARSLATITFKGRGFTRFQITVNTCRCFDSSCMRCLVI